MLPAVTVRTMRALTVSLFDTGGGIPAARIDWLVDDLNDFLGHAGPKTRYGFIGLLLALEFMTFFFGFFRRFSGLSSEARQAYLERVETSSLAVLVAAPKAAIGLCYYEHPELVAELGLTRRATG